MKEDEKKGWKGGKEEGRENEKRKEWEREKKRGKKRRLSSSNLGDPESTILYLSASSPLG